MCNNNKSKQLSFWQLINEYKIEVPIIQRDYAQGRIDKTKIRNRFLNDIKGAFNNSPIELDFVYGGITLNAFQPLDGQQRLTTLYLLHWYVAHKERVNDNTVKETLKKFTYKTRISSTEFCNELIEKGVVFNERNEDVSSIIKNASWFVLSWEKDPTIKAMLIMLDAIHVVFKKENNIWAKLIAENNRPITFHFIELENFGLSDELYIKMNARGKQLTPFEIFKADFIKSIDSEKWDLGKAITDTFSHRADTVWTDLFWKHKNKENKIDDSYIKFIAGIAINCYATTLEIYKDDENENIIRKELEEKSNNKNVTNDAVLIERVERRISALFNNPNSLDSKDFSTNNSFNYLVKYLDIYSDKSNKRDDIYPPNLSLWEFSNDTNLFNEFIKQNETTYKQRVLFYAQTEYLTNNAVYNPDFFSKWMRVVRNIVQNSTIDSASTFRGAMVLIKELCAGSGDIHLFLSEQSINSKFAELQVKEEVIKSKIIDINNEIVIFETEDTNFCKGRILFTLYCIDYENENTYLNTTLLSQVNSVIKIHLDNKDITNEFRRALLTIDDNHFYDYWSTSKVYILNEIPKRCLIGSINDLKNYSFNNNYKHYLKKLILLLTNQSPSQIIDDYVKNCIPMKTIPNWKKRLISDPKLLDSYCQSHFIAISKNEEYCYLLNVGKPSKMDSCKKII